MSTSSVMTMTPTPDAMAVASAPVLQRHRLETAAGRCR